MIQLSSGNPPAIDKGLDMDTKEAKCADKIAGELESREEDLLSYYRIIDSDDVSDENRERAIQAVEEMAYGIDTRTVSRVIWSGGGPSDYLDITHKGADVYAVEYHYQEWFDGAKLSVPEDSPAYRYALELIEILNA
jgi:hypothetical protein